MVVRLFPRVLFLPTNVRPIMVCYIVLIARARYLDRSFNHHAVQIPHSCAPCFEYRVCVCGTSARPPWRTRCRCRGTSRMWDESHYLLLTCRSVFQSRLISRHLLSIMIVLPPPI
ncbi:hypothetical protein IW262DRAFT_544411 [Armillaria fumosa]|nr:hypothetical protein IW262DRAFT_544411 [Armillaria fumosa]